MSAIWGADDDDDADALSGFGPARLGCGQSGQLANHVFGLAVPLAQDVATDVLAVVTAQGVPWDGKHQG